MFVFCNRVAIIVSGVFVAALACRTTLDINIGLDHQISTPVFDTKISHVIHIIVGAFLSLVAVISSLQISMLQPRVHFAATAVFLPLLLLFYYDAWMLIFVYSRWTNEFIWCFQLLQLIPAVTKIFNSFYQMYFLILDGRYPKDKNVKIASLAIAQALINGAMILHLMCNTVVVTNEFYKTGNILCLGIVLGVVEFVYRCLAIKKYWMLYRKYEEVEVSMIQIIGFAELESLHDIDATCIVTDLVMAHSDTADDAFLTISIPEQWFDVHFSELVQKIAPSSLGTSDECVPGTITTDLTPLSISGE